MNTLNLSSGIDDQQGIGSAQTPDIQIEDNHVGRVPWQPPYRDRRRRFVRCCVCCTPVKADRTAGGWARSWQGV
jgi:hypothetical protein